MGKPKEMILVLDFGGQYNQLIARRIRDLGVYTELHPYNIPLNQIKEMNPKGIVFSGGPKSVYVEDAPIIDEEIYNLGIPVLGICYGMQLITLQLKGKVEKANTREYGKASIDINTGSLLFNGLKNKQQVWMSHSDEVKESPFGFNVDARTESSVIAAISNPERNIFGLQFHPEVNHTTYGTDIINNFLFNICKVNPNWSMESFIEDKIKEVRYIVGDKRVLCALSGGVDSSVVAVLLHKAIGDQLTCMFIDHGLLRKDEAESVMDAFSDKLKINVIKIDAKERFLNKLEGITDPEQKRKVIGNEFIYVFEEEAKKIGEFDFLAQGTLYTDIIESGTKTAETIKSHHNVGGLPEKMNFKLIEPLNMLFKDEVRKVGSDLGIPNSIVWRQPFPGPGLAIRVIGEINEEKLKIVRESDFILRAEVKKAGLEKEIWQYFTVLTNLKSVGVMGDNRTYAYTIAIRAVTSIDGMTADWAKMPYDVLERISSRIVNEVEGVNRVVYDITSKPPSTIEWE